MAAAADSQCPQRIPRPILRSSQLSLPLSLNASDAIIFTNFRWARRSSGWQREYKQSTAAAGAAVVAAGAAAIQLLLLPLTVSVRTAPLASGGEPA
jgi:hypothetical protein